MSSDAGAEVDAKGRRVLHLAALKGDMEEVERRVTSGADIDAADKDGFTPLHLASEAGHLDVVDRLTEAKANLEAKGGKHSRTPLHLAAEKDHYKVVDRLLAAKAAVEAQDKYRFTPLHFAASTDHTATVDRLVAAGAAVDAKDDVGRTPLHWAAMYGHSEAAQRLVDGGADVDAQDEYGETPWDLAKRGGHETRMAPVLRPAHVDEEKGRELLSAAENGNMEEIKRLLSVGVDLDARGRQRKTSLHLAAEEGHREVVNRLLTAKAAVEAQDELGNTPLHCAAQNGHATIMERLVTGATGAVGLQDTEGRTPLHWVAGQGHPDLAQRLLDAGADLEAKDNHGETAWDWAEATGQKTKMASVLRPVHVAFVSGRSVPCGHWPDRRVSELKEEAERKLGPKICKLITSSGKPLQEQWTLEEAGINCNDYITALASVPTDPTESTDHHATSSAPFAEASVPAAPAGPTGAEADSSKPGELGAGYAHGSTQEALRDEEVALSFPGAIKLIIPKVVLQELTSTPSVEIVSWTSAQEASAAALLGDSVVLSPLVRLSPENVTFSKPVKVILPTCVGAETAYRSVGDGWEEVPAQFLDGEAELSLDHFCSAFVAGGRGPLKAIGYIQPTRPAAKLAIAHVGCTNCAEALQLSENDADVLGEYVRCRNARTLGSFEDQEHVSYRQDGDDPQTAQLNFAKFPLISEELQSCPTHFGLTIDSHACFFSCAQPSTGTAFVEAAASSASSQMPQDNLNLSEAEDEAEARACRSILEAAAGGKMGAVRHFLRTSPESAQKKNERGETALHRATAAGHLDVVLGLLEGRASVEAKTVRGWSPLHLAASNGHPDVVQHLLHSRASADAKTKTGKTAWDFAQSAGQDRVMEVLLRQVAQERPDASQAAASSSSAAREDAPSDPRGRHLMLSGRFNSEDVKNYMRAVGARLRDVHRLPVFMVDADAGDDFAAQTLEGLDDMSAMVAFCTEEYGAWTGAGYETFYELEFAHQQRKPIIPIRLGRTYPPEPQDAAGRRQNRFILKKSLVYVEDQEMLEPERVADEIARIVVQRSLVVPRPVAHADGGPGEMNTLD